MEMNQYYVLYNGKAKGPFTLTQIRHFVKTNQINPETPILVSGSSQWRRAVDVDGVFLLDLPNGTNDITPGTNDAAAAEQKGDVPPAPSPSSSSPSPQHSPSVPSNASSSPSSPDDPSTANHTFFPSMLSMNTGTASDSNQPSSSKKERKQAIVLALLLGWCCAHLIYIEDWDKLLWLLLVPAIVLFVTAFLSISMDNNMLIVSIAVSVVLGLLETFSIFDAVNLILMTDEKFDELYN